MSKLDEIKARYQCSLKYSDRSNRAVSTAVDDIGYLLELLDKLMTMKPSDEVIDYKLVVVKYGLGSLAIGMRHYDGVWTGGLHSEELDYVKGWWELPDFLDRAEWKEEPTQDLYGLQRSFCF